MTDITIDSKGIAYPHASIADELNSIKQELFMAHYECDQLDSAGVDVYQERQLIHGLNQRFKELMKMVN